MTGTASDYPHTACIGMGSNLGDSRRLLLEAWEALGKVPGIRAVALSGAYMTEPVDMESDNRFVNAAACIRTVLGPEELLQRLLDIEKQAGRKPRAEGEGYQDRTLDLDLLLFDDVVRASAFLELPHPKMLERLFVLQPLAEIAGDRVHPVSGLSINEHLAGRPDFGNQNMVAPSDWGR